MAKVKRSAIRIYICRRFYRLVYATPEEQKSFMDLWELQKQYVKNREKDQRKEDELRKSLTKKYTLHK